MRSVLVLALLVVLAPTPSRAGECETHAPARVVDPRFEFLERLAGTWVGTSSDENAPAARFEFRVTSGGRAVEEREMIGTPMEMLTVYHMDGERLVGTHYCMIGNQPRVVAARAIEDGRLDFTCDGKPGNAASHDEEHVHGWSIQLAGEDELIYTGRLFAAGKETEVPTFRLVREADESTR